MADAPKKANYLRITCDPVFDPAIGLGLHVTDSEGHEITGFRSVHLDIGPGLLTAVVVMDLGSIDVLAEEVTPAHVRASATLANDRAADAAWRLQREIEAMQENAQAQFAGSGVTVNMFSPPPGVTLTDPEGTD